MGKQGPCCHCGVTSTPLWRNGPPEKPVLCNACGSRWRTKGTLANYVPLHARLDLDDHEDYRVTRVKTISLKRRDEKLNKRKLNYDDAEDGTHTPDYSQARTFRKNLVEDTSNRSSSGSAISNSESCAQFGSADASDLTGPAQSVVWDALVPSRKRSCVLRPKQSSVEKLTKDLHTILHEQQASHFSDPSEEDLLFESGTPMGSVEFGHGSVLIRHPNSIAREEESEASSLSVDNKFCRAEESYATPASLLLLKNSKSFGVAKVKKLNCQIMHREQAKRDKSNNEKPNYWNHNSPLHKVDLTEIVNADVFWGHLTPDEQQFLLDYLPSVDTSLISDSLERMFANPNFAETLSSFKQLLAEGVFDSSYPGGKTEECEDLKRLVLSNFTKSKWVEHYTTIKDKTAKESTGERVNLSGDKSSSSGNMITVKKFQDRGNRVFPETKSTSKTPERVLVKSGNRSNETVQNKGSCFIPTPQNPFAFHTSRTSFMLDSFQGENENFDDQDVLLDIPSNGSFAQAELLHPISSFPSQQASATSSSSIHPMFIRP